MLHQALGPLNDHFGNPFMALRQLVKGGIDHLHIGADDRFLNIRNFLGTLVDQKDDQMHIRVVGGHGLCHLL